jgi:hypothetical protein
MKSLIHILALLALGLTVHRLVEKFGPGLTSPVRVISRGEEVKIESHVQKRGFTVVEFTADW